MLYKIKDIYFPIPLFVHIVYKYINQIYWYTYYGSISLIINDIFDLTIARTITFM